MTALVALLSKLGVGHYIETELKKLLENEGTDLILDWEKEGHSYTLADGTTITFSDGTMKITKA